MMRTLLKAVAIVAAATALAATGPVAARADDLPVGVDVASTDALFVVTLASAAMPPGGEGGKSACDVNVVQRTAPSGSGGIQRSALTWVTCSGVQYVSAWGKANVEYKPYEGSTSCCNVLTSSGYVRHTEYPQAVQESPWSVCYCPSDYRFRAAGYWDIHYPVSYTITDFGVTGGAICTVHNDPDDHWVHCGIGTVYRT